MIKTILNRNNLFSFVINKTSYSTNTHLHKPVMLDEVIHYLVKEPKNFKV